MASVSPCSCPSRAAPSAEAGTNEAVVRERSTTTVLAAAGGWAARERARARASWRAAARPAGRAAVGVARASSAAAHSTSNARARRRPTGSAASSASRPARARPRPTLAPIHGLARTHTGPRTRAEGAAEGIRRLGHAAAGGLRRRRAARARLVARQRPDGGEPQTALACEACQRARVREREHLAAHVVDAPHRREAERAPAGQASAEGSELPVYRFGGADPG